MAIAKNEWPLWVRWIPAAGGLLFLAVGNVLGLGAIVLFIGIVMIGIRWQRDRAVDLPSFLGILCVVAVSSMPLTFLAVGLFLFGLFRAASPPRS